MLGVTEATGICDIEAEEKLEYEDAQEVIGEEEEVTGEFFSRLGEFSHAFLADSILRRHKTGNIWVISLTHTYLSHTLQITLKDNNLKCNGICLPLVLGPLSQERRC